MIINQCDGCGTDDRNTNTHRIYPVSVTIVVTEPAAAKVLNPKDPDVGKFDLCETCRKILYESANPRTWPRARPSNAASN